MGRTRGVLVAAGPMITRTGSPGPIGAWILPYPRAKNQ